MRVIYVTARLPYGSGEPFIVPEIDELVRRGCEVAVVPVRPGGEVVHGDGRRLVSRAACVPLLSPGVVGAALAGTLRRPAAVARALAAVGRSRSLPILVKNLSVVPKALWLARYAQRLGADHLHAHWASTSATLAMLASEVSGIPWSFTAHRWDIREDNLLRRKAARACFVRAVSAHGAAELRDAVSEPGWSPWILHMGVELPPRRARPTDSEGPLRVLTAARFVEKKGHVYLLEATSRLRERGVAIQVELAGDGPLEPELRTHVKALGLEREIVFLGNVSHEALLRDLAAGRWHVCALPSVVASSGELEGIPVSLIEAMACGLPVIGTTTGGTPELLEDGAGLLVPPADPDALADAFERLAGDEALRATLADRGRRRVEEAFSVDRVAAALLERFRDCKASRRAPAPSASRSVASR
jgi:colanic acid/amylovoran biosynthesis glycosyltransferase